MTPRNDDDHTNAPRYAHPPARHAEATRNAQPLTRSRKAPSIALIASMLENHGAPYAHHHIMAALRASTPPGHAPSDSFYSAIADNRIAIATILNRLTKYIGGAPACWLLNGDELRNVQTERKVRIDAAAQEVARNLINEALNK